MEKVPTPKVLATFNDERLNALCTMFDIVNSSASPDQEEQKMVELTQLAIMKEQLKRKAAKNAVEIQARQFIEEFKKSSPDLAIMLDLTEEKRTHPSFNFGEKGRGAVRTEKE
jgi:hypothetical protein